MFIWIFWFLALIVIFVVVRLNKPESICHRTWKRFNTEQGGYEKYHTEMAQALALVAIILILVPSLIITIMEVL